MDYADTLRRHRRSTILRALVSAPSYSGNESVLFDVCQAWRVPSTRDQVRTELLWLRDQGFVQVEDIAGYMMATITEAGGDIAEGRRTHPDIQKPSPKKG